jgi:hypothetical protein
MSQSAPSKIVAVYVWHRTELLWRLRSYSIARSIPPDTTHLPAAGWTLGLAITPRGKLPGFAAGLTKVCSIRRSRIGEEFGAGIREERDWLSQPD